VTKEASLLYCLPDNPFFRGNPAAPDASHAVQEASYACQYFLLSSAPSFSTHFDPISDAGWIFAQHFCNRLGPAYLALKNVLDDANPLHAEVLNDIKKRFREETFTRQGISETILAYPDLVRLPLILEQE
jgi:glutamate dehydrogenase